MSENIIKNYPTVALRGMVMFPKVKINFEVGRKRSIAAMKAAVSENQKIFLVAQKDATVESPTGKDLNKVGIIAEVRQIVRTPETGNMRVVVEGICRAKLCEVTDEEKYFRCDVEKLETMPICDEDKSYETALVRKLREVFNKYISMTSKVAKDVASEVFFGEDSAYLTDVIASNVLTDYTKQQKLLEELDPIYRLEDLCLILTNELEISMMEEVIEQRVQEQMDKNQKEYYLREQIKAINLELGEGEDVTDEARQYKEKILALKLGEDAEKKLLKECDRLSKMQSNSVDANVLRVYLDECLALPWNKYTKDNFNLEKAQKILDADHYGLEKIKERFIEMLAVKSRAPELSGQIICLVGPPGVGKTSIVQSVAKAMGRKYVRMSLGGVRDEAEIRGHRKTYVGAMPGRIVSALKQAGSFNPIILLDEIDKLGSDYKGDPSSALLEVLDPAQNNTFRDNYIELPLDLSKVLFITTANDASSIPGPLYDRMEIIELSSYTLEEKLQIAKKHLVAKQRAAHGLNGRNFKITDDALRFLIDGYTREAGVRKLSALIAALCRKSAVLIENESEKSVSIKRDTVTKMLGPVRYKDESPEKKNLVGVVNGLAWTSVGGEMLQVEAVIMDGNGKLELTGNLGDVMKESARAAMSYIRSKADFYSIDKELFKTKDIHIHVPQGAVPKDGPSAGVTISTAILSAFTGKAVRGDVAMTGEISLTGRVMPIGGLREKTMAAYKSGVKTVIIPEDNESDLWEVHDVVKENVSFVTASRLDTVFDVALCDKKETVKTKEKTSAIIKNKNKGTSAIAQ